MNRQGLAAAPGLDQAGLLGHLPQEPDTGVRDHAEPVRADLDPGRPLVLLDLGDVPGTVIGDDLAAFITAARGYGYSERVASAMASQVIARVLFATGKRLTDLGHDDFDALAVAGVARQAATGRTWKHYRATATGAKTMLRRYSCLPLGEHGVRTKRRHGSDQRHRCN